MVSTIPKINLKSLKIFKKTQRNICIILVNLSKKICWFLVICILVYLVFVIFVYQFEPMPFTVYIIISISNDYHSCSKSYWVYKVSRTLEEVVQKSILEHAEAF